MTPWFLNFSRGSAAPLRLLCLPNSGGGANQYRDWAQRLDNVEVVAAQLPGRERRLAEKPIGDMRTLIDALIPPLRDLGDKPLILFGHSMGGLIAYELATALRDRGMPEPLHLVVSCFRSPERKRTAIELHPLDDRRFIEELRKYGGTPDEILMHEETMQMVLPMLRADFRLHETYRHEPRPKLGCALTAIGAAADHIVPPTELEGWDSKTTGPFESLILPGGHFYLNEQATPLFAHLQDIINRHLMERFVCAAGW